MRSAEILDLSSDADKINVKAVKLEPELVRGTLERKEDHNGQLAHQKYVKSSERGQDSEENRSSNALSTGQSSTSVLDQAQSPVNDTSLSFTSPICSAPLCRQFWNAGDYDDALASNKATLLNGKNYLHIHPMFLHSNATSHKWAFGAVAELLDNAVDEIQNGATFVIVDKTTNPRDGSCALLIQDDGGGMDSEAIRHCMSFGFSDKKSKSAIGQYGNGFKTSSMRLGADVIVFSRHLNNRTLTQSIGLLSYTFLTRTGHERIVVPMVDYEFNTETSTLEPSRQYGREHFTANLSVLLQWSPYSTEAELLKQFDDIGYHGTKVIVYNLWFNEEGNTELDFDSDPEDICLSGETKKVLKEINQQHIAHLFHSSLRVYLSILYLRIPESFKIILRGRDVEHHSIINDLKFLELIMYRPHSGGCVEGGVVTTIGFLKEAPLVNFHGFNVYHKNRLILPFWQVVSYSDSRGRGVVGVLEANFIEPTHNKQDFERTSLFQKLEGRLKEMTWEYWDYHCGLIGYQVKKKPRAMGQDLSHCKPIAQDLSHCKPIAQDSSHCKPLGGKQQPVILTPAVGIFSKPADKTSHSVVGSAKLPIPNNLSRSREGLPMKRVEHGHLPEPEKVKRQAVVGFNRTDSMDGLELQPVNTANQLKDQEAINLLQENKKLRAECLEYEKRREALNSKVIQLRNDLGLVRSTYDRLLAESRSLHTVKEENNVNM